MLGLLALLVLGAGFIIVQANRRPSIDGLPSLTLPVAPADAPLRVRYAGVATLLFDDGETAWMTDGFFSRPTFRQVAFGRIEPDADAIATQLSRLGVTRLAAVVPVHSHYDHAMDSPIVAQRTGALLVGSESTLNIGRGVGLPEERMRLAKPGEAMTFGKWTIRFIASRHSPTPFTDGVSVETIDAPLKPPARATDWREGQTWSLHIEHASGRRMLVQGSAGYVPGSLAGLQADTVFLGTGTLGRKPAAYKAAYWEEVVRRVGAKRVVPIHWDAFWVPLDQPLEPMPYLADDFAQTMADLRAFASRDGIELRIAPLVTPFVP